MSRTLFFPLLLLSLGQVHTYNILIYNNLFGHSHLKVMGAVADTLTDAGHNVTVLMPIIESQFINKTALKSTKNIVFVEQNEHLKRLVGPRTSSFEGVWTLDNRNPMNIFTNVEVMKKMFGEHCRNVMAQTELVESFRAQNFDLAITDPFDTCAYGNILRGDSSPCPRGSLRLQPFGACERSDRTADGSELRAGNVVDVRREDEHLGESPYLQFRASSYLFSSIGDADFEMARQFYPEIRSWREVVPEASFIFTNQISYLEFPAPTFDKMVPIGGLSVKTDRKSLKLEEKWSKILDIRQKNVLISFGSNARSVDMPDEVKSSLLRVFESMSDVTFIWKYESPEDPLVTALPNVFLSSWLPQNELLADARLTVFVTHGGLASVMELAMMGKPCVMIPLVADQTRNAEMLKRHGGAAVLSKFDLTDSEKVKQVIETVLTDRTYHQNALRLAEILHNQPTNPKETLVKYVEFAARFGKLPSLDNFGRHQTYIEYFFLDIIALFTLLVTAVLYLGYVVLKCSTRKCKGSSDSKKEKRKSE